ncbi:phosphopantetheine-binding protein [Croceibacterium sp. TMG7-5b_MA50]|uniref:phosphopantetheine-binding protein n=1 Tax=Croceibacterium sp. TMG7-5b_MA50 TaxID=3121290 RepID=UPI00322214C6
MMDYATFCDEVAEFLGTDKLDPDISLLDQGLDSMRAMNLAMEWEELGIPLDFADLAQVPTLAGLWVLVEERRGS